MSNQITDTVLMVRPAHFGFNPETAENNAFQVNDTSLSKEEIAQLARTEFDIMVTRLRSVGVKVIVIEDTPEPLKTDAVFPNNWFSTHKEGTVVLYPMFSANRRLERREDIIELLESTYQIYDQTDYLEFEDLGVFVEGTGSMILDRQHRKIYACISERSSLELLQKIAGDFEYQLIAFNATDSAGVPYYHTNVIMALGTNLAIVCLESIDENERTQVTQSLQGDKKIIIDITRSQVEQFAGNMLEVLGQNGEHFLVMSSAAHRSLTPSQISIIEAHVKIIHSDLSTIEKYGGGSARCMMAEIYLPKL